MPTKAQLNTNFGDRVHDLTAEDRQRAIQARRRKRAELEQQAVQLLTDELLGSLATYVEIRNDDESPAAARIAAADRIVDRLLGKVGERLELSGPDGGPLELARVDVDAERIAEGLRELGLVRVREQEGG